MSALLLVTCGGCAVGKSSQQLPGFVPNAPEDKPFVTSGSVTNDLNVAIIPYVKQAMATYPEAKKRYLQGLPPNHFFQVVTRLRTDTAFEQVFVAVSSIEGNHITGKIVSDVHGVPGYKWGDLYSFPESELIDWVIVLPNGTEEGNFVGKFLDQWLLEKRGI